MKNKFIIVIIFVILFSILLTSFIDKELYHTEEEYIENNIELKNVEVEDEEKIEIRYEWQIAIPKIDMVAPIGEGSDIVTLRNRVGHIIGTGKLSRKYLSSSDIIILIIIKLATIILIK